MMEYKGYIGKVEMDEEAGVLYGEVINVRDVITFEGKSIAEIKKAFRESVDDYLDFALREVNHQKSHSLASLWSGCPQSFIAKRMFRRNWKTKA